MSSPNQAIDLSALKRASGAFAMLAIDQRESLKIMLSEARGTLVSVDEIVDFKMETLAALTPLASAVLIDQEYAWEPAIRKGVVHQSCGLIAAADRFSRSAEEAVAWSEFDKSIDLHALRRQGAKALKLLVIWRPDGDPQARIAMVDEFVACARHAGLISIVEPVSRRPLGGGSFDLQAGIIAAARELGNRGQDLYKAEMPFNGVGDESVVRDRCAQLGAQIASPWVILSAGVTPEQFPTALGWACKEGAEGFLAGRAVWKNSIGASDFSTSLKTDAVDRLKRLCDIVDEAVARSGR